MILYKAINYDGFSEKVLNSEFYAEYSTTKNYEYDKSASCFEDIIKNALSHISQGNKKRQKDYWISTTSDYSIAINKYLNDNRYNFNGIAVIELPNTMYSGYIYDYNLRERGYIDKVFRDGNVFPSWNTNSDGIAISLDMSSEFTVYYLSSYLWLKGNIRPLHNWRAFAYAIKDKEVLIMGQNIKFKFISRENIDKEIKKLKNKKIDDYYEDLFKIFIESAPDSDQKEEFLGRDYRSEEMEYDEYLSNHISYIVGEDDKYMDWSNPIIKEKIINDYYINESEVRLNFNEEIENEREKKLMKFYKNTRFKYIYKKAYKRFLNFKDLKYENKDSIDFSEYEVTEENKKISFDKYLYAYFYSNYYLNTISDGKLKLTLWKRLYLLYDCKFIEEGFELKNLGFYKFLYLYNNNSFNIL